MDFTPPVAYLLRSDFTSDGNLVASLARKPVFVMIQTNGCGHCVRAKPAFQQLANEGAVTAMTIDGGSSNPAEKPLKDMLDVIYPNFRGFPSYMMFVNGKRIPYTGDRSLASMRQFVANNS